MHESDIIEDGAAYYQDQIIKLESVIHQMHADHQKELNELQGLLQKAQNKTNQEIIKQQQFLQSFYKEEIL